MAIVTAMPKKTTRNYIWILTANFLLLVVVAIIWQVKLETPVFGAQGPKGVETILETPYALADAPFIRNLKDEANLSDFKGQWLVLNLWASWCPPCITEMPSLQKLAHEYRGKGLQVLAISVDTANDADGIRAIMQKHNLPEVAANWDSQSRMYETLRPEFMPTSYIVDPAGRVHARIEGERDWASVETRAMIDALMIKASTSAQAQP